MDEISFDSIMKNHRYWPENLDIDAMSECIRKIKRIKNKIFFEEKPEHPEIFFVLFSDMKFIDSLLDSMVESGITQLNKIWLREYSKEVKQGLLKQGVIGAMPAMLGFTTIIMCREHNDFFVNVVL